MIDWIMFLVFHLCLAIAVGCGALTVMLGNILGFIPMLFGFVLFVWMWDYDS